jgi:hypothetical protein
VSLYLALAGQASCGRFGRLTLHPGQTFAIDVGAVAALWIWRPAPTTERTGAGRLSPLLKIGVGAAVLLALSGGAFLFAKANPVEALAWFRGEAITVDPPVSDVGKGQPGEERTFRVELTNRTRRPIRVIGGTTNLSCSATGDLPLTLAEGETGTLEVSVRFVGSPGRFQYRFVLLTDDEEQPEVVARYSGRVIAPP